MSSSSVFHKSNSFFNAPSELCCVPPPLHLPVKVDPLVGVRRNLGLISSNFCCMLGFSSWYRMLCNSHGNGFIPRQVYFRINYIHTLLDHRCLIKVIIPRAHLCYNIICILEFAKSIETNFEIFESIYLSSSSQPSSSRYEPWPPL